MDFDHFDCGEQFQDLVDTMSCVVDRAAPVAESPKLVVRFRARRTIERAQVNSALLQRWFIPARTAPPQGSHP